MTPRPLSSFLSRLIWLCMAPLLLLAVWLAWENLQEQESRHLREGANLAKNYATSVDQYLRARINALHMLANSPLADDPRRRAELYAEAQGFQASFGTHVIFADTTRQMLFNTRAPFGTPLPRLPVSKGRSAAPLALESGKPEVGDIVTGPVANLPLVAIVVPGLRQGKVAHLMLTTLETSQLQQRLDQLALPSGWSIALQDGTGADIARRSPPGFDPARDVAEDHRFVVRSERSSWTVVLEIPRSGHDESQRQLMAVLVAAIVAATLLGALGGTLAGRRIGRQVALLGEPVDDRVLPIDIAELAATRKRLVSAVAESQASEARFRRLLELAPMPLALVADDGRVLTLNERFQGVFGYTLDDLPDAGAWFERAYPDPAVRRQALDTWRRAANGADIGPRSYQVTCKDGTERDMLISAIPQLLGTLAVFIDITEQRRAERALESALEEQKAARLAALNRMEDANAARRETEAVASALRESQERLQLLIDHAPAALAMFDRDMRYLAVSRRWREDYGLGERDILGHSHYEIFPEITEAWKVVHRRGLAGEVVTAAEDRFERLDGSVQWLRWEVRPWLAHDGGVGGIVIFSEDITRLIAARHEILELNAGLERRVAERTAELTAANQELDAFAYAVSHDLRAPLRAMSGFSQALLEDYGSQLDDEARGYLGQVDLAARRMGELIDGILALSRSTRGELRREGIDVSARATERLTDLARHHPERRVEWDVEPGLVVRGDPSMLGAVLDNLLGNAWKYTGQCDPARIRVHAGEIDGLRGICVSDNGAGFDMAHAARLFHPFQRLHRQDEFPGIGIGLATVQRIVKRHGGTIVATAQPGRGASFCFTLSGNVEESAA